jgi:hypothetical protein
MHAMTGGRPENFSCYIRPPFRGIALATIVLTGIVMVALGALSFYARANALQLATLSNWDCVLSFSLVVGGVVALVGAVFFTACTNQVQINTSSSARKSPPIVQDTTQKNANASTTHVEIKTPTPKKVTLNQHSVAIPLPTGWPLNYAQDAQIQEIIQEVLAEEEIRNVEEQLNINCTCAGIEWRTLPLPWFGPQSEKRFRFLVRLLLMPVAHIPQIDLAELVSQLKDDKNQLAAILLSARLMELEVKCNDVPLPTSHDNPPRTLGELRTVRADLTNPNNQLIARTVQWNIDKLLIPLLSTAQIEELLITNARQYILADATLLLPNNLGYRQYTQFRVQKLSVQIFEHLMGRYFTDPEKEAYKSLRSPVT